MRVAAKLAALLLLLAPAAALRAQTPGPGAEFAVPGVEADATVLLTCLASGKAVRICLGAMTLDCMAENDIGNENLEERLCIDEELSVWRDLMRQAEARLKRQLGRMPPEQRPALSGDPVALQAEAALRWTEWLASQCALERLAAGASQRRAIIEDACLRDLTAARYGRLQKLTGQDGAGR